MPIPQHVIDEIRAQADMIRIISDYVPLKKRGVNYIGCCPFHQEKTPSFNVNPSKQVFKCFGCGVAGSIFSFIMQIEHVPYPEAVRVVAQKCGITVPEERATPESRDNERERERLLELNELAARFFEKQLETTEGRQALNYLVAREITDETRATLRIGYAPNSWDALSNFLKNRGAAPAELERSGLVTVRESAGGAYDRFRGRVIFPILNAQGRVVAFGGRILGDGEPKYLNSPETPLYVKSRHLYGLHWAKDAIRRAGFAVVVEGYFDFAMPFQEGVRNVVATLGTALTDGQIRLLRRSLDRPQVVLNFDPDRAGQAAAKRGIELFLEQGFKVNVLNLPSSEGKCDPDAYVREFGGEAYRAQLKSSRPFFEYLLEQATREFDVSRPNGKVAAVNSVLPYLVHVKEPIERALYSELLADRLKIDDKLVRDEMRKSATGGRPELAVKRIVADRTLSPVERRLLTTFLADPDFLDHGLSLLQPETTEGLPGEIFLRALRELRDGGFAIDYDGLRAMLTKLRAEETHAPQTGQGDLFAASETAFDETPLDPTTETLLAELLLEAEAPTESTARQAVFEQIQADVQNLERQHLKLLLSNLQREIEHAGRAGDHQAVADRSMKKLEISRRLEKYSRLS